MKIKTSELIDEKLNWAVVKASGQNAEYWLEKYASEDRRCMCESPSTNWSQGGPIIERKKIAIDWDHDCWNAYVYGSAYGGYSSGPTALVAAMRNYVAFKLGDEVEIPEELT